MKNLFIPFFILFIVSCNPDTNNLPGYSGNSGEMVVVISNNHWNGNTGKAIKEHFEKPQSGLPQPEALFHLVNIPEKSFSKIFQTHRNVFMVDIKSGNEPHVEIKKNLWAKEQLVVRISAPDEASFLQLIDKNGTSLAYQYQGKEINRLISRNKKFGSKKLSDEVYEKHGLRLTFQKDAYIATDSSDFMWIRIEHERPLGGYMHQISQGILIYYYPYTDTSQFDPKTLLAVKDSITKKYLPGPVDSAYMATSYQLIMPEYQPAQFKGNYAMEIRGLWRMENAFMGGPFVSLTTLDKKNSRLVTIEGYVYSPQFNKREYIREIEAMIRSLEIPDEDA